VSRSWSVAVIMSNIKIWWTTCAAKLRPAQERPGRRVWWEWIRKSFLAILQKHLHDFNFWKNYFFYSHQRRSTHTPRRVIYGCTDLLNAQQFVKQVRLFVIFACNCHVIDVPSFFSCLALAPKCNDYVIGFSGDIKLLFL
jgi:hypothetical protein